MTGTGKHREGERLSRRAPSRIVLAPDSFKGTISAVKATEALAAGWLSLVPDSEIVCLPMADGGEGTVAAFSAAVPGSVRVPVSVTGPHDERIVTEWLWIPPESDTPDGTAVIELASASGIELLAGRLRPLDAHTLGFGEAVADAIRAGVSRIIVGIGSSSSTDGGIGVLSALGAKFLDVDGVPVRRGARGLLDVEYVDLTSLPALPPGGVTVISDVISPLSGARGAAAVFGPQKGLEGEDIGRVDAALRRLARLMGVDSTIPGTGAAGGTGLALLAWGASIVPGSVAVARLLGLEDAVRGADLVVTGEGSFDGQSAEGKAPNHVAHVADLVGLSVALVAGRIGTTADTSAFKVAISLSELAGDSNSAMMQPEMWLRKAGRLLAELFCSEEA